LNSDAVLRDRFAAATQLSPVTVLGPLAVNARAAGCPGLLLAGDAAGFVDPMTGDGLRFALRGGELAADAALNELATGRPAYAHLGRQRRREFSIKWRINRALRMMVGSPGAVGLASLVSAWWSAPVEFLIQLAGDVSVAQRRT
jgi:flavin-dependent dehydrogenase